MMVQNPFLEMIKEKHACSFMFLESPFNPL